MISRPRLHGRPPVQAHPCFFALALLAALQPAAAAAQTRLYGVTTGSCVFQGCLSSRLIDIDVERLAVRVSPLEGGSVWSPPFLTADGSYVVLATVRAGGSLGAFSLDAVDTTSHWQWSAPMPMPPAPYTYFTHPSAMRAFAQRRDTRQILVAEPGRIVPLATSFDPGELTAMSGDGARLFATRGPTLDVVVIDAASGAVAATIPGAGRAVAVNDDGSEMFGWRADIFETMFDRRAVPSGTILASTALGRAAEVVRDPRTGRLWTILQGQLRVLDGETLALVGALALPVRDGGHPIAFDPDAPIAYVGNHDVLSPGRRPHFLVINTMTLAIEAAADLEVDRLGQLIGLALGPRPPRVTDLSAAVNGTTVTLSWTNAASRSLATHLVVEAGSARGLTNLARLVVPAGSTSFTVTDVPRGTYFVRMRAVNGSGQGVPTSDITVAVP
jgi:hypothetical protein